MYYIILVIVAAVVVALGATTNMLRDMDYQTPGAPAKTIPYSWSRTQLAFWMVIILSSFLYLFFKFKFEVPELNTVNLILLGIVVATTASAKLIDDTQKSNPNRSQDFPSQSFLHDILSDKNGVSIHRLQNVIWTLALGIVYVQYVGAWQALPDDTVITDNLLILMGISTGTYLGIKTTENTN